MFVNKQNVHPCSVSIVGLMIIRWQNVFDTF